MVRFIVLILATLSLSVAAEGTASERGDLTRLGEVRVVVEDSNSHMKEMGLTEEALKKEVVGLLLGKLPRVAIDNTAKSYVYVNVNVLYGTVESRKRYYFGNVMVQVKQPVINKNTGQEISAAVWGLSHVLTGPPNEASEHVFGSLNTILNKLAADWYQDNPVKHKDQGS
ncbi:MAG: hypothetical protein GTO40_00785 [Deltaproteobacteria bacterium]|nr:hypothetical protein [Deltaproteobacteria bacterium]